MRSRHAWMAAAILVVCAAHAAAQSFGVRAGASADPDQFYAGVHVESGALVDRLHFRPNVEIGVGDDQTLVAFNFEFAYHIPIQRTPWSAYVGAGPALDLRRTTHDTSPEGGFNILIGLAHRGGLFTELKAGFADSPGIKFAVGYAFPR